ncbi:MAG: MFS transporter [Betaproteobacteria bacterium]
MPDQEIPTTEAGSGVESPYAWARLAAAVLLMGLGGCGMYSVTVVLPLIQAEFGVTRAAASLPYTATMVGFTIGGVLMGRFSDRFGVMRPIMAGALCLAGGLVLAAGATSLWQFVLIHGLVIGLLGTSTTFGPLVADISHWFTRRRGLAVAICVSGNYLAGTFWPPVMQALFDAFGWRTAYLLAAAFCLIAMIPLAWVLRRPAPIGAVEAHAAPALPVAAMPLGLRPAVLQALIVIAGISCCVAMSMPQVHIVAYCGDLGFAAQRGAEMLSLMLGFGIVSRMASGWIADRIGALRTLLLGSMLQAGALALFLPFNSLASLYAVSAFFGLVQGGIVPMYALIVRDYFPASEAGARVSLVLMATVFGMAIGGWLTGAIFDLTGSYHAAFLNGIGWNLLNLAIVVFLLQRSAQAFRFGPAATKSSA